MHLSHFYLLYYAYLVIFISLNRKFLYYFKPNTSKWAANKVIPQISLYQYHTIPPYTTQITLMKRQIKRKLTPILKLMTCQMTNIILDGLTVLKNYALK
jgi:hypothetical protein